jgi:two-component system nitrogen regulation sensor histidine kinase NtrY
MLKQNQTIRYLILITGLILISLGYVLQKVNFVSEQNVYQNLTKELDALCKINKQNLEEYHQHKKTKSFIVIAKKNEVIYWNTNEINIDEILLKEDGLVRTKTSWELLHKKCFNDTCVYALLKIKQEYPFENNFLANYFNSKIDLNKDVQITEATEKDKNYFTVENKKYKLNKLDDKNFHSNVYITLEILGLILAIVYLITFRPLLTEIIFVLILITIRILLFSEITLIHLKETELFSPNIFAWNQFIPSLADLFLHFLFLSILALKSKNHILKAIVSGLICGLLITSSHILVIHSDIFLNLENILNITTIGWFIIILFVIKILTVIIFLSANKSIKSLLIFILVIGIFEIFNHNIFTFTVLSIIFLVSHFISNNKNVKTIILILSLSLLINYNLNNEIEKKSTQKTINSLEKKSEKRSIITEYLIVDMLLEVAQNKNNLNEINKNVLKSYINKLPGEFEFNFGKCGEKEDCITVEKSNTFIEKNKDFELFYNITQGKEYYTAILYKDDSKIWITLKENKKDEDYGFPILLANPKMQSYYFSTKGSFAKYHNKHLIYSDGKFDFPKKYLPNKNYIIYENNNYIYVFIELDKKQNNWWLGAIYLLIICLSIYYFYQFVILQNTSTQNFRFKIQLSILILIVFSIGIIALGSIYIQKKQQTQNLQKNLLNNVTLVGNSIENKINVVNTLEALQYDYLQKLIENLGENYTSDINLYDTKGYLINTTREQLYDKGILSKYIHPVPFEKIKYQNVKSYIQLEKVGKKLNYFSAYHGVYNDQKQLIGIIHVPYFTETKEFNNDINEYILSIINIYILLIIIALITGYIISEKITEPLKILSNNLQNLQLNNLNQQLKWNTNDEIGQLIKQYNLTLEKLELNIKKLAKKERESAWREMAQQVAHEIKNPLTPMKLSMQHFLMRWDDLDEETKNIKFKSVAKNMIEQMDQLAAIASDFSSFAKINEGKKDTILLDDILNNVISVFNTNDIIEFINYEKNCYVNGNKNELNRVFTNIIQNAIQAVSEKNKPNIQIQKKLNNQFIEIKIKDNGDGIPVEIQDKIFIPKFTTKNSGSGLGLAMVKQIIDFHEGKIYFETSTKGTTFTVLLPLISSK